MLSKYSPIVNTQYWSNINIAVGITIKPSPQAFFMEYSPVNKNNI